jgi:L-amino acid N-acyltransferase YncA
VSAGAPALFAGVVRAAVPSDAAGIAQIYNDGVHDRTATFETQLRSAAEVTAWIGDPVYPLLVFVAGDDVLGWIRASEYRERACYRGIAEFSVYVRHSARGRGVASSLVPAFLDVCARAGFWKLVARIFTTNQASRSLCARYGFREVGIYEKHGRLDGVWRDVVIVERLIEDNMQEGEAHAG